MSKLTPLQYIRTFDKPVAGELLVLHKLITKTAPKLKPVLNDRIIGYGTYHYKYASGHEGDTCAIGLAKMKQYYSLYTCGADERGYVAEQYKQALPKANIGKGCIRFKRLSDLDLKVVEKIIKHTMRTIPKYA